MLFFSLFQNGDVIEGVATKRNGYLTLSVFEKLLKGKAAKGKSTVRGKSVSSIHRINLKLSVFAKKRTVAKRKSTAGEIF